MVKIAAMPKCWIESICSGEISLDQWIDISCGLECDGLELYSGFLTSHDDKYLSGIRSKVESLGMSIPMMCYSPDFTVKDKDDLKKEIEKQKEMIRVTAVLGGKFCRTLSGQRRPDLSIEDGISQVADAICACLPTAEQYGVKLVMENHYKDPFWKYPEFAQKKNVFLGIINRIDSPFFGVQYDPSNAIMAGDDPIELLDQVISRVATMHASDRYLVPGATLSELTLSDGTIGYSDKLCHGVTGKGLNDYDAIFMRLKNAGFDGWISIEDGVNGFDEMKESIDFLKMMRKKYYGGI